MSPENALNPQEQSQTILSNVQVSGNFNPKGITQVIGDNNLVINTINEDDSKRLKPTGIPQNIPRSNTIKFVGRADSLEYLHEQLQKNGQMVITAVEGMGGLGKTELAIQYSLLHLLKESYQGGICWLQARKENIGLKIIEFAKDQLGLTVPDYDDNVVRKVKFCWTHWEKQKQGRVLLVLDDVIDYSKIQDYLPPVMSQFKVLITTRLKLKSLQSFTLEVLPEKDAMELLEEWIGKEKVNQQLADVKKLCEYLGCLPLALNLVGSYLQEYDMTIAKLLEKLAEKGLKHDSLKVDEEDQTQTLKIERGVQDAFELSWEVLSKNAQKLGCFLSLFAVAPIDWELVESCLLASPSQEGEEWEEDELLKARNCLTRLHLILGENPYQYHQLIRQFFQGKLEQLPEVDTLKRVYCQNMVTIAEQIPQTPTIQDIATFQPVIPHLAEVADKLTNWLSDENQEILCIFCGLARFYEEQGFELLALSYYEQCRKLTCERLGEDHPDLATSLNNLATLYRSQGNYSKAELLYQKALVLMQKYLREDHPNVATCLNNLAEIYSYQKRYNDAKFLYQKALALRQKYLREDHPYVASSLNNLAYLYAIQRKDSKAELLYKKALVLRQKYLGEDHPDVASSLNNLAALYRSQKKDSEAELLYQKALVLRQKSLGEYHPDVAISMHNLAFLYYSQKRYEEAEPLYVNAIIILVQRLEENHPKTQHVLYYFLAFLRQVISTGQESILSNHPLTQSLLQQIKS